MKIRKATPKDFKQLNRLKKEFFLWEAQRDENIDPKKVKIIGPYLGKKLRRSDMAFFIAEQNSQLVGYAWAEKQKTSYIWAKYPIKGYLHDLYVKKEFRKKGLGKKLIDECFKWFKKQKLNYIDIGVHTWNKGAKKLYQKKGFKEYVCFLRIIRNKK